MQTAQNQQQMPPFLQQQPPKSNYSRSEQNFYKMPSNTGLKTEQYPTAQHYGGSGYQNPSPNERPKGISNYTSNSQR